MAHIEKLHDITRYDYNISIIKSPKPAPSLYIGNGLSGGVLSYAYANV